MSEKWYLSIAEMSNFLNIFMPKGYFYVVLYV